jgi:hypothetical protein
MAAEKALQYRGCVITWPEIRVDAARWIVNLASDDPRLLGRAHVFHDTQALRVLFRGQSNMLTNTLGWERCGHE